MINCYLLVSTKLFGTEHGTLSFAIEKDKFTWKANTSDPNQLSELTVKLEGAGVLASNYLWSYASNNGKWHHFALTKDAATGAQAIWIDGESQPSMQLPGSATPSPSTTMPLGDESLYIDDANRVALCAALDEIAVYDTAISPELIYQHYRDAIIAHLPYNPVANTTIPPNQTVYPGPNESTYYDMNAYAPGTELPSPPGDDYTRGATMDCVDQLLFMPDARLNKTALAKHTTPWNFNWMASNYMAGENQPGSRGGHWLSNYTVDITKSMSERWRYGTQLKEFAGSSFVWNETLGFANEHPEYPLHMLTNRRQTKPKAQIFNQSLQDACYLQNGKGKLITILGVLLGPKDKKVLRPMSIEMSDKVGCPDSTFNIDGKWFVENMFESLAGNLTRSVDLVNADGEIFISLASPAEYYNYSADPSVLTDFKASGIANWTTYWSEWRLRLTNGWSDVFMKNKALEKAGVLSSKSGFSMYQVQGSSHFFGNWSVLKKIGTPDFRGKANTYFSTEDFYLQSPREWWGGGGPDHGIEWTTMTRASEIDDGDILFSPFVAAGWSAKAEKNVRPAQWLGLMKILAAWGAEWFYGGFFSVRKPFPPSQNWCWQASIPTYTQAMMSQWADFMYDDGELVNADANTTFAENDPRWSQALLWGGAPNILAIARRIPRGGNGSNDLYLLTVAGERLSNADLNFGGDRAVQISEIALPGFPLDKKGQQVMFRIAAREQGSVVVYRNDSSSTKPVAYQLDTWHENTHPLLWPAASATALEERGLPRRGVAKVDNSEASSSSSSPLSPSPPSPTFARAAYEAEVFEGHLGAHAANWIATELANDAQHAFDFVDATSFLRLVEVKGDDDASLRVCIQTHPPSVRSTPVVEAVWALARGGVVNGVAAGPAWEWVQLPPSIVEATTFKLCMEGTADVDVVVIDWS